MPRCFDRARRSHCLTEVRSTLACMFGPNSSDDESGAIEKRFEGLEDEVKSLRLEVAELRAAHDDALDLALAGAVPNGVFCLINEARAKGWIITYSRRPQREGCGTVKLIHSAGAAHDYSLDLPLPDDSSARRKIESELRMRIGWTQAA